MKGDSKKQLRSNHQKGHVNKEGIYIKHTDIKGKRKPKQNKGDKPMRRMMDPSQRHLQQPKFNVTKPNIDFGMGGLPVKGAPKMPGNLNIPQHPFRPPQVGAMGNIGNVPPTGPQMPMRPQPFNPPPNFNNPPQTFNPPAFNPPPQFPGANMPPPFKPAGGFQIPPGIGGAGIQPPKLGQNPPPMVPPFSQQAPKLQPPPSAKE